MKMTLCIQPVLAIVQPENEIQLMIRIFSFSRRHQCLIENMVRNVNTAVYLLLLRIKFLRMTFLALPPVRVTEIPWIAAFQTTSTHRYLKCE